MASMSVNWVENGVHFASISCLKIDIQILIFIDEIFLRKIIKIYV